MHGILVSTFCKGKRTLSRVFKHNMLIYFFVKRRSSPVHSHELHSMTNCNIKYNMNSVLLFLSVAYHASICLCKTLKHRVKIYRRRYMRDNYTKYTQTVDRVFSYVRVMPNTITHIAYTVTHKIQKLAKAPKMHYRPTSLCAFFELEYSRI